MIRSLKFYEYKDNEIKFHNKKKELLSKERSSFFLLPLLLSFLCPSLALASEKDLYDFLWLDPDKKVYVLQNKVNKKNGSFYINAGVIKGLSNEFQSTVGGHVSFGHYFAEEWAIEAKYNSYSNKDNDALKNIQLVNSSVPFIRNATSSYGLMAVYAPFYGKINTFNKIIYFDWSFGLGAGKINTESNALTASNSSTNTFAAESYTGVLTKTALRIHITKKIHMNIEYHRDMFQAPGPLKPDGTQADAWRSNSDVILSVGLSF
jgi:outer membrane beta-barrel protein